MNQQITVFEDSGFITDCEYSWSSFLLLAAKPPQDDCTNINAFI